MTTYYFLIPSFNMSGGLVKMIDYLQHLQSAGYDVALISPAKFDRDLPFIKFLELREITITCPIYKPGEIVLESKDILFLSLPSDSQYFHKILPKQFAPERVVHLIQNTRHANPKFQDGVATRLLGRPFTRISISNEVTEAIEPFRNPTPLFTTIVESHDWEYFYLNRKWDPTKKPISIGYTTWKSQSGDVVSDHFKDNDRYNFVSIREHVNWPELRDFYHSIDVYLAFPSEQEGFYLPGLEAMAAGCLVVTPDVEGNRAYCEFGKNCVQVEWEKPEDYIRVIENLENIDSQKIIDAGYNVLPAHHLDREKEETISFLSKLHFWLEEKNI